MNRCGRTRHSGITDHGRIAPAGFHLTDEGHLLVNFQSDALFPYGIGMAKFDKDGNVIWKRASPDFSPGEWNRAAFCVIG